MTTYRALLIFLSLSLGFQETLAQDQSVEKIQVTGSRIKRINIEGPSPLLVLDKEDLENSGYNSAADVLRSTNIAPFGVKREAAGSELAGESFIEIHGAATLILVNGQRIVGDPSAEAVDLHLIPIYAIERVEIIKDGSSALYGSDALGGVINFIMKKNFSGTEIHGRVTPTLWPFYKGGSRLEGAAVWGKNHSRGSTTGVLQFRFNDSILSSDRVWSTKRISPVAPYPVVTRNGISDFSHCPEPKDGGCPFDYADLLNTLPRITQLSGYIQGNYKKNGIDYYAQILPSYKHTYTIYPPLPGTIDTTETESITYRYIEAGPRIAHFHNMTLDSTFGAKGYLSSNWDWDVSAKISGTFKGETRKNLLVKSITKKLINEKTFNPFNDKGNRGDLSEALYTTQSNNFALLMLSDAVFSGNVGPIDMALGAQALYTRYDEKADPLLTKVVGKRPNGEDIVGDIISADGSDGSGYRYVFSTYAEAAYSPIDSLEFQFAVRGDLYSDLAGLNSSSEEENPTNLLKNNLPEKTLIDGLTVNPKLAFRFQPTNFLLFRGSAGTSFIAPSMHNLYGSIYKGYPYLIDNVACYNELKLDGDLSSFSGQEEFIKDFLNDPREVLAHKDTPENLKEDLKNLATKLLDKTYCVDRQYTAVSRGNPNLKETKGKSISLGSVLQWGDVSLTTDVWYISTSGSPTDGINGALTKVELKEGRDFVQSKGVQINRDNDPNNPANPILNKEVNGKLGIESRLLNIASSKISGVDFSLSAHPENFSYKGGRFYVKDDATLVLFSRLEAFPGRGFRDVIGSHVTPKWKNVATLGWRDRKHDLSLRLNSFAASAKLSNELEKLPSYHRLDVAYQWAIDSKTFLNAGWVNVFLTTPPRDKAITAVSQINEDIHEVRGPHFYVGFKKLL